MDGTIDLEKLDNVLYVGRPAFGQENSTISLFKLTRTATSHARAGEGRPGFGEFDPGIEGLNEGDTVILSDMSRWDNTDRIRLD